MPFNSEHLPRSALSSRHPSARPIEFEVWGSRGSRNIIPPRSRLGNRTSCYSLSDGETALVFDGGGGLVALAHAALTEARFSGVRRVVVLLSHAHMDHWEGLKDAEWFWTRDNGLHLTICGPEEALEALGRGTAHPSYVPLDVLARGTLGSLEYRTLSVGTRARFGPWMVSPFSLNHFSGGGGQPELRLDTLGYRAAIAGGPAVAYLCDHQPTAETRIVEEKALNGAQLALYDSHFLGVAEHAFGHGSIEHAASVAREHEGTLVLSGHVSARYTDAEIREAVRRHARGVRNFQLAVEGAIWLWDAAAATFERSAAARAIAR